jgi:hypothetical protein
MNSIADANTEQRHAWLRAEQDLPARNAAPRRDQSDFEKSFAWRLAIVAAIVVIAINLFHSASPPVSTGQSNRATV